ncbi:DUF3251 domain-containing protein [Methylibium rhizosphaerae]|uniref:DUF3251 domain-containing protein n=1 Tax=Methylibium rhizosphaerae TaxID=2570323 RepID=UPI001129673B|nr:DUF3251 domain-containing protein [Methylibium rhizosphaerae]
MRHTLTSAVVLTCLSLVGCTDESRVKALEERLAALEAANKALATEVQNLEFRLEIAGWDRIAYMKPGDSGYSAIRYDLGVVTVKISDIKPYANGSKIWLQFGNLASARVDGLKATIEWGSVDDKGNAQNDRAKSREVAFSEPLAAGAWTTTELVLEGIPPAELGFVRLRDVGHRGIGLRR